MPDAPTPEVTALLLAWGHGDEGAFDRLVPMVHAELRRIARRHMGHERVGHTLQPTALVNEAYLKLVDITPSQMAGPGAFFRDVLAPDEPGARRLGARSGVSEARGWRA